MARTHSIHRRLAAVAVLAALSFGFAGPPVAANFGLETAGAANGKAASSDSEIDPQGISWK